MNFFILFYVISQLSFTNYLRRQLINSLLFFCYDEKTAFLQNFSIRRFCHFLGLHVCKLKFEFGLKLQKVFFCCFSLQHFQKNVSLYGGNKKKVYIKVIHEVESRSIKKWVKQRIFVLFEKLTKFWKQRWRWALYIYIVLRLTSANIHSSPSSTLGIVILPCDTLK